MRPTIPIQQRPLLVGQITGSAAVNVGDSTTSTTSSGERTRKQRVHVSSTIICTAWEAVTMRSGVLMSKGKVQEEASTVYDLRTGSP